VRVGLRGRMLGASVLVALIVAGAFAVLLVAVSDLHASSRQARHAEQVIATATELEKLLIDAQAGQRGFVITGQESFLAPWRNARKNMPLQERSLDHLLRDNPAQERRAREIVRAIDSYLTAYSLPLVTTAREDRLRAREIIAAGHGNRRVDAIRGQFDRLVATEHLLAAQRQESANDSAHRAVALGFGGLGLSVFLILLFAGYLTRVVVRPVRELAAAARRVAGGDLSARIAVGGSGEIRGLTRDFDAMTAALEQDRDELEHQNAELEAQQTELETQQAELERALAELAADKERIDAFYDFGGLIAREIALEPLAQTILRALAEFAEAELGTLYVADESNGEVLMLVAGRGIDVSQVPSELSSGQGLMGRAATERRTLSLRHDGMLRFESFGRSVPVRHELHVPLASADRLLGMLTLGRVADEPFAQGEIEGIDHLAAQAAIALSNATAYGAAQQAASINAAVLNATKDAIVLIDPNGTLTMANAAGLQTLASRKLTLDGDFAAAGEESAALMTAPEEYRDWLAAIEADPDLETSHEYTVAESSRTFLSFTTPVLHVDGERLGRVFVVHETTAEREAQRLKSELVATVSHELRTPLTGMLGFAELLLRDDVDEETRKRYLEIIYSEGRRLTALVNDFLDLQRIEEGSFALALEPFDLAEVLAREIELYSAQSAFHELVPVLPAEPLLVLGEGDRIAQVVGNLLSNAIKYSPEGGRVELTAEPNGRFARVAVRDSGLGIPADQQRHVFDKFFRVDSSDTREIGGTGLGLAVCREIVEAHGGRIGFESVEREGSTFWFELPVAGNGNGVRRRRVLVIEDDASAATVLDDFLAAEGYEVELASTGELALARATADPPALICLDVGLGGKLGGWDVLERLKSTPATAHVPVVVCTGKNGLGRAATLGAADFLAKPFEVERLLATVRRLLPQGRGEVLVVEDDPAMRRLVGEALSREGLELREAENGSQAMAEVARRHPDVIILDLQLPALDGFEVLERLHDDPETRQIPVVIVTGRNLSSAERAQLRAGTVGLLEKSEYSARELRRLVSVALGSV
jgi:signal transduction histidine kinase/DNA-binding response OmpR family regulator/CHASE3 domain sensor protein